MIDLFTYLVFGTGQNSIVGDWSIAKNRRIKIEPDGDSFAGVLYASQSFADDDNSSPVSAVKALVLKPANIKNMWEGSYTDWDGIDYFCLIHWANGRLVVNLENKDGIGSKTKFWNRV